MYEFIVTRFHLFRKLSLFHDEYWFPKSQITSLKIIASDEKNRLIHSQSETRVAIALSNVFVLVSRVYACIGCVLCIVYEHIVWFMFLNVVSNDSINKRTL